MWIFKTLCEEISWSQQKIKQNFMWWSQKKIKLLQFFYRLYLFSNKCGQGSYFPKNNNN